MPRHSSAKWQYYRGPEAFYTDGLPLRAATPTIGRFLRTRSVTRVIRRLSSDSRWTCCTLLTELRGSTLISALPVLPAVPLTRWIHAERSATCPRVLPEARPHAKKT